MTANEIPTPAPGSLRSDVARQLEEVLAFRDTVRTASYAEAASRLLDARLAAFSFVCDNADTLRRALAALTELESVKQELSQLREAVEKGIQVEWSRDSGAAAAHLHGQRVLIIPADAVEVSRG